MHPRQGSRAPRTSQRAVTLRARSGSSATARPAASPWKVGYAAEAEASALLWRALRACVRAGGRAGGQVDRRAGARAGG
jgi:hypothetical protein